MRIIGISIVLTVVGIIGTVVVLMFLIPMLILIGAVFSLILG